MDIYAGIDAMRDGISRQAWRKVETAAAANCRELDPKAADAIAAIDLMPYRGQLSSALREVLEGARSHGSAAVYWEFDPDNGWDSAFFLCGDYTPEADGDDEWASDFDEEGIVRGPAEPNLAALYATSWDGTPADAARNLFLIGRTVAAFGQAAQGLWPASIPLCAGHHDQDSPFRLVEAA
jgi:hypothetical protein